MILRKAVFLLATFLFLPSVEAMDELIAKDQKYQPVKVHIWKDHIAVQTQQHYMSFRHPFDILKIVDLPEEQEAIFKQYKNPQMLSDLLAGLVPSTFQIDQEIQDKKIQGNCPCETFTLLLDHKAMDIMWGQLTESAEIPAVIDGRPIFRRLRNVKYLTPADWARLQGAFMDFDQQNVKSPVLYFSNTTLIKGLLHWGKIYNPRIYPVKPPIYFKSSLQTMPSRSSAYDDVLMHNRAIRGEPLSISQLYNWIYPIVRHQNLFEIHQYLEEQKMDCLALSHEKEIIRLFYQAIEPSPTLEERKNNIYAYLVELKSRYEADKKSWGVAGWSYTFGRSEWKK